MTTPLVSIVIPTTGRSMLLVEAIRSAVGGMGEEVEVIVIPNGPDHSWRNVSDSFANDTRVKFEPIEIAHANAARNHGLDLARGRFVRFLDDDDYLIESGAKAQYAAMQNAQCDICTGAVSFVDAQNREFNRYRPMRPVDLVQELFLQRPSTLPVAHVFSKAFIGSMRWDTNRPYLQDVDWMYSLARRSEIRWLPLHEIVGVWRHHAGVRLSVGYAKTNPDNARRMAAEIIKSSIETLSADDRLSPDRRKAAAKALWDYAPGGFIYAPVYWSRVAMLARKLDGASRPVHSSYHRGLWVRFNPVAIEWIFLPLRILSRWIRSWIGH